MTGGKAARKMAVSELHKHDFVCVCVNCFPSCSCNFCVLVVRLWWHYGRNCHVGGCIVWAELCWLILYALGALERFLEGEVSEWQSRSPSLVEETASLVNTKDEGRGVCFSNCSKIGSWHATFSWAWLYYEITNWKRLYWGSNEKTIVVFNLFIA